jgi:SAM-dependent methyltransferase
MFDPPLDWVGRFDLVVSFGLIEHFEDTSAALSALCRLLRKGGTIVTVVPNMHGTVGLMQKLLNRPIYDIHVPISSRRLREATEAAGATPFVCDYFGAMNYFVNNLNGLRTDTLSYFIKRNFLRVPRVLSGIVWAAEMAVGPLPAIRAFAPYVVCLARRA